MTNKGKIKNEEDDILNEFMEEVETLESNTFSVNSAFGIKTLIDNDEVSKILENEDKSTDIWLKRIYGLSILTILILWEIFVVKFSMKQLNPCTFQIRHVSDPVFITLLTTATANILILPTIVLKYLFPNGGKK